MKVILDELTPKEFFSNGGVVKVRMEPDLLKNIYKKRNTFLFYEYKAYIRFMRELYLNYMAAFPDITTQEAYRQVNPMLTLSCSIGTKQYTTDTKFDEVDSLELCRFYYCYDTDFFERTRSTQVDIYGMPNVNFSTIGMDDSRWGEFEKQRLERGFDDSEIWSLDKTLVGFILPRLKAYRDNHCSIPENMTPQQWDSILDKMVSAFELMKDEKDGPADRNRIEYGLKLFAKYLKNLWD